MEKYESPRIEKFQNEAETALALDRTYFAWGCGSYMAHRFEPGCVGLTLQEVQELAVATLELTAQMPDADVTIRADYREETEFSREILAGKEISDKISSLLFEKI